MTPKTIQRHRWIINNLCKPIIDRNERIDILSEVASKHWSAALDEVERLNAHFDKAMDAWEKRDKRLLKTIGELRAENGRLKTEVQGERQKYLDLYSSVVGSACGEKMNAMVLAEERDELRNKVERLQAENEKLKETIEGWELGSRGFP